IAVAVAAESNLLAVRRPAGGPASALARCQLLHIAAVGVHHIKVRITVAVRYESDFLGVGGNRRADVLIGVVGEQLGIAAIVLDRKELHVTAAVGWKEQPIIVGWPGGHHDRDAQSCACSKPAFHGSVPFM